MLAEFLEYLRKVSRVVLVVHLCGHLENDELVDAGMYLAAAFNLKVPALAALPEDDASKLLHEIIGSVDRLFVLNFAIL